MPIFAGFYDEDGHNLARRLHIRYSVGNPFDYRKAENRPFMSTTTLKSPVQASQNTNIVVAFLGFIAIGMNAGLLGLAWTPMRAEFGQSLDALGLLLLASTIGYLASSFLCGAVTGRIGIGWTVLSGGLLLSASLAAVAILQTWWLIIPIYIIAGIGTGLIDAGLNSYIAEHHSKRTLNWLHACFGVGTTIIPIVMTRIIETDTSWRLGFGLVAGFCVLVTISFGVMLKRWQVMAAQTNRAETGTGISLLDTLKIPAAWIGIVLFFVYAGLESSPGTWMYPLYNQERGIAAATAGFWVSVYWGSFTVGRIFFGAIINYIPNNLLIRACLLGTLIGAALVWWSPSPEIGFFGLALLGFAQSPMFAVFISQTPSLVGARYAPNVIGFQVAGAGLGVALIPGLLGVIADRSSLEIIPPLLLGFAVIVVILYEISQRLTRRNAAL